MRYTNVQAFQKHPVQQGFCHLVIVKDDWERDKILRSYQQNSTVRLHCQEGGVAPLMEALQEQSLFSQSQVVIFDECEKLGKKEVESLGQWIEQERGEPVLILGSRGKTGLVKWVESRGAVLDLSEEKPWDREKRLQESIGERALQAGKRLGADAAALLFERIGPDAAWLDNEMEKLICFVGDKLTIDRTDVFRIASKSSSHTIWQMAEAIVWDLAREEDEGVFHGLIPAVRSQLQMGMTLCQLIEAGVRTNEWSPYFPKVWPRTLEKRSGQAAQKGSSFYQRALDLLFKIELLSRTGSNQFGALLDLFYCTMRASHGKR